MRAGGNGDQFYGKIPNLRNIGAKVQLTKDNVNEYVKCMNDCEYFVRNYVNIQTVQEDQPVQKFDLYPYQKEFVQLAQKERFIMLKCPRQSGKTSVTTSVILWYILFRPGFRVAVMAQNQITAKKILKDIKFSYVGLPFWMQQGVAKWNELNIELENGSQVLTAATSSAAIRGRSLNLLYLDEFAFVPPQVQEDFFVSAFPAISSSNETRLFISSTPRGLEMFYKFWTDSEKGNNPFKRVSVHWKDIPGRDEKWKAEQIAVMGAYKFRQEFETEFLGSSDTLIDGAGLAKLRNSIISPIAKSPNGDTHVFEHPIQKHMYVMCVDVGQGVNKDYSAAVVIDVTHIPYKVVATYYNNVVTPFNLPNILYQLGKNYNDAAILIEQQIGMQTAMIMQNELEYENLLSSFVNGRSGQILSLSGVSSKTSPGIAMSKQVKQQGCNNLKAIIENNRLIINDMRILKELSTFVAHLQSYRAEKGNHDDLVMSLVMFAWLTGKDFFKHLTDTDLLAHLREQSEGEVQSSLVPFFGYIDDGVMPVPVDDFDEVVNAFMRDDKLHGRDEFRELSTEELSYYDKF